MTTSLQHRKAQLKIQNLLVDYYHYTAIEAFTPTPNNKYLYDGEEFTTKPYLLDVYAHTPRRPEFPQQIGVEIDGKKGHKTSKRQTMRDKQRTLTIETHFPTMKIFRFDTKDLIGRGYVNPKTKRRSKTLSDEEILTELGIICTHL